MLYQPTNLIPSAFAGEGNDVIDAAESNVFSALMTGSSSVIWAYRLHIMRNDTSSTDAYDTGVVQLSEPFYPMNYNGVQNRLEITVPSYNDDPSNLMRNEITDGYKWTLSVWEQYDSENPDESMVTSVEQFFWTKSASNIQIVSSTAPATITSRENLWKATYTSTSSVQWFQWTLAEVVDGNHNTVYQTGRIYGSSQIWFEYSGLVSGRTYAVQVQVVNQYGQSVISPWATSLVQYDTVTVSGATDINQIEEGVRADWSGVQYIEGDALYKADDSPSTNYEILDDYPVSGQHSLDVESDTYVRFESSPTFKMEASEDGTFVWAGRPDRYDPASGVTLLEFTDVDNNPIRTLRHEGFVPGLEPGGTFDRTAGPAPIVSINTDMAATAKSLTVSMSPIQDLHGYDSPWPAGGGKNLMSLPNTTFVQFYEAEIDEIPAGTYVYSGVVTSTDTDSNACAIIFLDENKNTLASKSFSRSVSGARVSTSAFTVSVPIKYVRLYASSGYPSGAGDTANFNENMIESGSATTYAPYSNICPITGRTGLTAYRTGKNLFDLSEYAKGNWSKVSDAQYPDTYTGNKYAFYRLYGDPSSNPDAKGLLGRRMPLGQVTISFYKYLSNSDTVYFHYVGDDNWTNHSSNFSTVGYVSFTSKAQKICDGVAFDTVQGSTAKAEFGALQIEIAAERTNYESYTGQSYPVTWQSEAGTVYGGTLDVVSGVLTVDRAIDIITKDSVWYGFSTGTGNSSAFCQLSNYLNSKYVDGASSFNGAISSTGREAPNYWTGGRQNETPNEGDMCFAYSQTGQLRFHRTDVANITDLASFKANFPDTSICYYLATPITYQLTPTQIQMLEGANNIFSDGGDVTLIYSSELVPGAPLVPDDGHGGEYVYTSPNGTYTQSSSHAPYHWYVVEMPPDGIIVHEFDNPDGEA